MRWGAVFLAFAALVAAGVAAWGVWQFNRIDRVGVDLAGVAGQEPQNFLLVGSDTRDLGDARSVDSGGIYGSESDRPPGGKRADTIVVARVDPKSTSVELLSIPRDLWVSTSTGGHSRINSAYNEGPQELIDSIKANLGIPIHHFVEVNFNGFKGLVDAAGGVPLYFDRPVRDASTGLSIKEKGCYTLDGVQALAFARSRHMYSSNGSEWVPDQTGDLGRITRQQVFLRHAATKVTSLGLNDLNSLRQLVGVAVGNVKLDAELGTDELIALARRFSKFDAASMVVHRLETEPYRTSEGASVLQVVEAPSTEALNIFRGIKPATKVATTPTTVSPGEITVDVLNGVGVAGLARTVATELEGAGFQIGEVGNTDPVSSTVVAYGKGAKSIAEVVASKISPKPAIIEDPSLVGGTVQLRVAGDVTVEPAAGSLAGSDSSSSGDSSATNSGGSGGSTSHATVGGASGGSAKKDSGAGTLTPEGTLGLNMGDPPPGVSCG